MRGNKKLVQGIAAAGAAGMLVYSVTFSQPQIMQTEEAVQITRRGTVLDEQLDEVLAQALSIEKHDIFTVAAGRDEEETPADDSAAKAQGSVSDSSKEKETASETENKEKNTEEEKGKKTETEEAQENQEAETKTNAKTEEKQESESKTDTKTEEKQESETKADTKTEEKQESESKTKTETEEKEDTKTKSSTAAKWENKLMADVDDRLNIRKHSSADSKIIGRLRKGDTAEVIKKGKKWTKIKSGSVTGYVKNSYCVYGADAYKLAKKVCKTYATVLTDGLRIRKKPSGKATILDAAFKGDKLVVKTKAASKDGWIVVKSNDCQGYVSEKYVKVALGTGEAISIKEEMAQIAAQQKAQQNGAAAASSENAVSAGSLSQISSSDLTLLSAIIFCEAGGESYEGQVAVGAVVMNRVRSGSYPNSISGVVYQSGQFSPVSDGALARALSNGNYQHCTTAAREALAGSDNTGGAKFFHRVDGSSGLVIGNHVFY